MKTEFLKGLGLTDEQISSIMKENGIDIENEKAKTEKEKKDLKTAQSRIDTMTGELEELKSNGANAEEWKTKFESLQRKIADDEKAANEQREAAEKAAEIENRYNAVCVDKNGKPLEFSHDAIKASYLQKFTDALSDKNNESKSDADIFHELTKDDNAAFKGVQAEFSLPGAKGFGGDDDSVARAVMGLN